MNPVVLQAENITKKFPGVIALKDVGFDLRAGEIHGLSGENGAGKSTLIKLLSGIYPYGSYEGNFFIHGQLAKFRSLADAQNAGLAVIYQELALVNDMTVGENIFLGSEPRTARGLLTGTRCITKRGCSCKNSRSISIRASRSRSSEWDRNSWWKS